MAIEARGSEICSRNHRECPFDSLLPITFGVCINRIKNYWLIYTKFLTSISNFVLNISRFFTWRCFHVYSRAIAYYSDRRHKGGRSRDWHSCKFVATHVSRDWSVVNSPGLLSSLSNCVTAAHVPGAVLGDPAGSVGNKNGNARCGAVRCRRWRLLSSDSFVRITKTCETHPPFVLCVTMQGHARDVCLAGILHAHTYTPH